MSTGYLVGQRVRIKNGALYLGQVGTVTCKSGTCYSVRIDSTGEDRGFVDFEMEEYITNP